MATYLLADGDEATARELLRSLSSDAAAGLLDGEIGRRYSVMAHSAVQGGISVPPRSLARWVERALKLNPAHEIGWTEEEEVALLVRALDAGADLRIVSGFVDLVLSRRPDSEAFTALRARLDAAVGPLAPPAATQPVATQPADDQP
jgi:hypothetical protein